MLQPDSRTNIDAVRAFLTEPGRRDAPSRRRTPAPRRPRTRVDAAVDETRRLLWQERLQDYTRGRT